MSAGADQWIRLTTTACVGLLALIAGTVSYLHLHMLVELHGQPSWVAALTPLSVDGMIVAASTTLLADSRAGERGGVLPWTLLVVGSAASLAANVAVAQPTAAGRVIAAWPSFALIGAYELLMRQVRRGAASRGRPQHTKPASRTSTSQDRAEGSRDHGDLPLVRVLARATLARIRLGIFSARRGSGLWPTGQPMAHYPAGVRSPTATTVMSGGAAWSNAQASRVNSPGPVCDCWTIPHGLGAMITASRDSEHPQAGSSSIQQSGRDGASREDQITIMTDSPTGPPEPSGTSWTT